MQTTSQMSPSKFLQRDSRPTSLEGMYEREVKEVSEKGKLSWLFLVLVTYLHARRLQFEMEICSSRDISCERDSPMSFQPSATMCTCCRKVRKRRRWKTGKI